MNFQLNVVNLPRDHTHRKKWPYFYQEPSVVTISSSKSKTFAHIPFTYWYLVWLKISQVVCDGVTITRCLYIRNFPAVSTRHHFLIVIHPLWPLHFFYFLFLNDAWTLGVALVWYECPIQGWVFHSVYQLQIEDSLIRTAKRTNLSL